MRFQANSGIPISKISIDDPFWNKYRNLVGSVIIPYQWDVLNDRLKDVETSHCIENFRIAAGLSDGKYEGAVFQDTDLYKWLEAVGFYLSSFGRDEKLEKQADSAIDLVEEAQQEDGYLDTYFIINAPDRKWQNLEEGHELYTAGHMIEAAVAYFEATGKRKILDIAIKLSGLLCRVFGSEEGKIHGYPGHPEVELALVKLYRITGKKEFLELAKYFINIRGVGDNYFLKEEERPGFIRIFPEFNDYDPSYSQSHIPVREQKTAEGHAVRAGYLYSAMADIAAEYDDRELLNACKVLWDDMVHRRMYVTGSIGSSGYLERFTTDYDLPNDCNYSESCASIALAMFGKRMAEITGDSAYMDEVERALYNTVLSGVAMDGRSFFYVNPLEVWPESCLPHTSKAHVKSERQKWFGVACCPPNIARTLASLGQYIYFLSGNRLSINLYVSSEAETVIGGVPVRISTDSGMPWEGKAHIRITCGEGVKGEAAFRIPYYGGNYKITGWDGGDISGKIDKGYCIIPLKSGETEYCITFDMKAHFVYANPKVRSDTGKAALMKGPLVYCLEETDNGQNLSALFVDTDSEIHEEYMEKLLGGSIELKLEGMRIKDSGWDEHILYREEKPEYDRVELTAVPYCYWGNRCRNEEMMVWINRSH